MAWIYLSENVPGNLHDAARYVNSLGGTWDVVAMHSVGGTNTVVVHRTPATIEEVHAHSVAVEKRIRENRVR